MTEQGKEGIWSAWASSANQPFMFDVVLRLADTKSLQFCNPKQYFEAGVNPEGRVEMFMLMAFEAPATPTEASPNWFCSLMKLGENEAAGNGDLRWSNISKIDELNSQFRYRDYHDKDELRLTVRLRAAGNNNGAAFVPQVRVSEMRTVPNNDYRVREPARETRFFEFERQPDLKWQRKVTRLSP